MEENRFKVLSRALELGVIEIDGQRHYPAIECAEMLGFSNPEQSISDYCKTPKDENWVEIFSELYDQLPPKIRYITDSDLFRLIIRSPLPLAQAFECWVFDQVLPAIRKTGVYVIADTFDNTIQRPQFFQELLWRMEQDFQTL